jgi:hypothetical protein
MARLIYSCPSCRMSCIHGVNSPDDVGSLTNQLPIALICWRCQRESLVVPRDRAVPADGIWDTLPAHARRIAEACSQRAVVSENEAERRFFLKMEWCWRRVAERSGPSQVLALVSAMTTRLAEPAIRRIA